MASSGTGIVVVLAASLCAAPLACLSIAGVGDYHVDDCFDACADGPPGSNPDGKAPENDGGAEKDATDAPTGPDPGKSHLVLAGTGVPTGQTILATLTVRDAAGKKTPRPGAKVGFTFTGGSSVLTAGPANDLGDGTYTALLTGVTEGTKVSVVATLDGAPLKTPAPKVRVANPVTSGITLMLDAANADDAGNPGGKGCPGAGLTTWTDLGSSHFPGALLAFADPCAAGSGWAGKGTPDDPFRLTFDGADDVVDFGAVNSIRPPVATNTRQTILAWVRKTGPGLAGTSGFGGTGLAATYPVVAKGTAEGEMDAIDINYFLSVTTAGVIGVDYEVTNTHANTPLSAATPLKDNSWYMIGYTLDIPAKSRVVYLNAVADAVSTNMGAPSAGDLSKLNIGGATATNGTVQGRFKGDIAIVLTYNRALGLTEIEKNCHAYSSRFGMTTCPN